MGKRVNVDNYFRFMAHEQQWIHSLTLEFSDTYDVFTTEYWFDTTL